MKYKVFSFPCLFLVAMHDSRLDPLNSLGEEGGKSLRKDLEKVFSDFNIAKDDTTTLYSEYLEVDASKK